MSVVVHIDAQKLRTLFEKSLALAKEAKDCGDYDGELEHLKMAAKLKESLEKTSDQT
jgi:hypothetical protein